MVSINPHDQIVEQALQLIARRGIYSALLEDAAIAAGLTPNDAAIAFPDGIDGLIEDFFRHIDQQMIKEIQKQDFIAMKVRERIKQAVLIRLSLYQDHKEAIRHIITYLAKPWHCPAIVKSLAITSDHIWYEVGDRSSDMNYYSKRTILSGIYSATILYWLQDYSEEYKDTKSFLDNRINDIMIIPKVKNKADQVLEQCRGLPFIRQFCSK